MDSIFSPLTRRSPPGGRCLKNRRLGVILLVLILGLGGCGGKRVQAPAVKRKASERAIKKAIRSYLGAPYRYGGSSPSGVDCSGLVMGVYQQAGIRVPRTAKDQYKNGEKVDTDDLRYGDVVFFNQYCQQQPSYFSASIITDLFSRKKSRPCHSGIYIGGGRFIHASSSRGVCISNLNHETWRRSFIGARRYLPSSN
ncbi:MAG: C40 family peptidase [Deltaproteobacteria bacterium]|nr:C40 family peptidase [Deltaproteobacteria bacterium]MBW1953381.1 C40 family peptidase [Deltaproteobacteria bacterium]MBW1986055.1 C40 family peptidase [Deltaproteobacteria bacterium]MBW2133940.1 C40 family peptidase [Deltaproteobacteria bacterium]